MWFLETKRISKFDKLNIRLNSILKSTDDAPQCVWSMLIEMGKASKDFGELRIAYRLRDRVNNRMIEQERRPMETFEEWREKQ